MNAVSRRSFLVTTSLALPAIALASSPEHNWPMFRGAGARGIADGYATRTAWNADPTAGEVSGVLWRTEVPGLGHSSPIVWDNRIFIATAVRLSGKSPLRIGDYGDNRAADDDDEQKWVVLCFDKRTGQRLWERVIHTGKPRGQRHQKSSHANTSLVTDGHRLVAFFGSEGLHCFDLDGRLLWSQDLGLLNVGRYGIGYGFGSSPVLHRDRIVLLCDDPTTPFVASYRLSDGQELWRVSRVGDCERSWGTPLIHMEGTTTQVVTNGWPFIVSYELESGKELWRLRGAGDVPIPSPFIADGLIVVTSSHGGKSPIYAIRPTARGDITLPDEASSSEAIAWSNMNGGSYISTPVVYDGHLFLANRNGVVRSYEFRTGRKVFEERLGTGVAFSSSLVAADGKVYCPAEEGVVYVLKPGASCDVVAQNQMGEPCLATPAISQGVIYFRTVGSLLAIGS